MLYNDSEVKLKLDELGVKLVSKQVNGKFNDSEVLAYDLGGVIEGEWDKLTCEGTIAFVAIQRDLKGKAKALYFGRNTGNPLKMKLTDNSVTLSSEGDGDMVEADMLYRFDYDTYMLTKSPLVVPTGYDNSFGFGAAYNYGNTWYDDDDELGYLYSEKQVSDTVEEYILEADGDFVNASILIGQQHKRVQERLLVLEALAENNICNPVSEADELEMYELTNEEYVLSKAKKEIDREADKQTYLSGFPLSRIPASTNHPVYAE